MVLTNKKTGSLRHAGQQHAGSNTTQGATHVFRVGFVFPSTLALVGVHKDEDVVHTDCKHQKRDNLGRKKCIVDGYMMLVLTLSRPSSYRAVNTFHLDYNKPVSLCCKWHKSLFVLR